MNGNITTIIPPAVLALQSDPITDEILGYLSVIFKLVLNPTLAAMGLCVNIINVVVFYKMGLSDGVTQNFFILSISDFLMSAVGMTNSLAYILQDYVYRGQGGSPETISQVIHWATTLATTFPQNFSLVTTAVIAVVRCCCVAMPLRVKYLITAQRQLVAIFVFSGSACIVNTYVIAPVKVVLVHNPLTNSTLAVFMNLNWYTFTIFSGAFFYIGFNIVIICVIILSISLFRSSRFREKSTSASGNSDSQAGHGRRETRIVKTVVFVSVVFIVCYLPTLIFIIIGELVGEFSPFGVYRNSNNFLLMAAGVALLVNADVNIFIYIFSNNRFRGILVASFKEN